VDGWMSSRLKSLDLIANIEAVGNVERRCDTFCQPETLKISHYTGVRNVDSKVKRRSCV